MLSDGPYLTVYDGDPTSSPQGSTQPPSLNSDDLAEQVLADARSGPAEAARVVTILSLGGRWRNPYSHARDTLIGCGVSAAWLPAWERRTDGEASPAESAHR